MHTDRRLLYISHIPHVKVLTTNYVLTKSNHVGSLQRRTTTMQAYMTYNQPLSFMKNLFNLKTKKNSLKLK